MSDFDYADDDFLVLPAEGVDALEESSYQELSERFNEEELLIMRYAQGCEMQERQAPTIAELEKLINWLHQVRTDALLIDMALKGFIHIELDATTPGLVHARATSLGREAATRELTDGDESV